jgi:signal transduction histidine kinase
LRSIRTKFGLVTGSILLILLLVFYLGGRFILVHMLRNAEKNIQMIGSEVKNVVYAEVGNLRKRAVMLAGAFAAAGESDEAALLQRQLVPQAGGAAAHFAALLNADGSFRRGFFRLPDGQAEPVAAEEMAPYLQASVPLFGDRRTASHIPTGVIILRGKPALIAMSPVEEGGGGAKGFLLIGTLFSNHLILDRIHQATHGMQVAVYDRRVKPGASDKRLPPAQTTGGLAPIFTEALNYYSGGLWHLGENAFEAVIPIHDILGRQVTSISIRLPQSFSSLASIALGWLTVFVASVGIIFVLPMFWLQTRIVLNPLCTLASQIRKIGERPLDSHTLAIDWPRKDEFGMLAQSVNGMLEALVRKTRQVGLIEQRQRALIAGMPDGLCVFDEEAHLIAIHKQPDSEPPIPGLIAGHPVGPPFFKEKECATLRRAIAEALATEKPQRIPLTCQTPEGAARQLETRVCRMDGAYALVIFRDVTSECREREVRVQMEDRLTKIQKMESLGNLAAGIAHDFNNILAIIQNTVEVTWETPDPETREAVTTICQATGKGAALTRELMTYAGQTRISFKRDDPNTLILDLEKLMGGVVAPNVSIELKLTPDLPQVDTDPHQFWKVLINLLKNASEAMNGARGHICISTYPFALTEDNLGAFFSTHSLSPGNGVVFQVDDTGSGIPREMVAHLFEPFFSTKSVGRGLGLATVFAIIDAHNGGIAIDSEPGKGTTFRIWLPAAGRPAGEGRAEAPRALQTASGSPLSGEPPEEQPLQPPLAPPPVPRILLIEDDPAILLSTSIALRSLNVDPLTAATKREALAIFRKQADSIALVLLDAHIGHLDNVRLLSTLRLRNPNVPIVVISGYNEKRIREMFASEAYEGFLAKPYTRDELKSLLDRFVANVPAS